MCGRIGVFAGSFDPIHNGHVGVLRKAATMFDKIIIAIGYNPDKESNYYFPATYPSPKNVNQEDNRPSRMKLIKNAVVELQDNIALPPVEYEVSSFSGLLVDFAKRKEATSLIRSLRATSDFDYEFQMALMNKKLNPDIETVFFMAPLPYLYVSSTIIRQILKVKGDLRDVKELLPRSVYQIIHEYATYTIR